MHSNLVGRLTRTPLAANLAVVGGAAAAAFVSGFVKNLVLARVLGPVEFGAWTLGLVVISYAVWSHLSVLNAFRLEGARTLGRGEIDHFLRLQRLAWTAAVFPAAILIVAGVLLLGLASIPKSMRAAIGMSICLLLFYQLYAYAGSSLYARERFTRSAQMQFAYAICNVVLTLAFALAAGFWGGVLAQLLSFAVALWLVRGHVRLLVTPLIDRPLLWHAARIGLPLALNAVVFTFFTTIDRALVAGLLGVTALGQYALTALARSSVGLLPIAIADVINMRAANEYGATKNPDRVRQMVMSADRRLAFVFSGLIGLSMIWAPVGVSLLLPRYSSGVVALNLFLAGLFFTIPVFAGIFLQVTGRASELLAISAVVTAVEAALVIAGIRFHGIEGAAAATASASILMFVAINVWGLRRASLSWGDVGHHILVCFLPFGCILATLALVRTGTGGTDWYVKQSLIASAVIALIIIAIWRVDLMTRQLSAPS